jgi:hypothetical protein
MLRLLREGTFRYRLMVVSALGAFGGATFLGLLNTYAVYWYAYACGCRIPIEGVGYLSVAVALMSMSFIIIVLTSIILVHEIVQRLVEIYQPKGEVTPMEDAGILVLRIAYKSVLSVAVVVFLVRAMLGWERVPSNPEWYVFIAVCALLLSGSASFLRVKPEWGQRYMLMVMFALVGWIASRMFNPVEYARLLNLARFGGGVRVIVTRGPERQKQDLFLILQTTRKMIAFDDDRGMFLEIPNADIEDVEYPVTREALSPFRLAERKAGLSLVINSGMPPAIPRSGVTVEPAGTLPRNAGGCSAE